MFGQPIRIPHGGQHIFLPAGQLLPHLFVLLFPGCVLPQDDLVCKLDEYPGVSNSENHVVQAHEEANKQEQALGHDAHLAGEHGNAVVSQFVLVKHELIEEVYRVGTLEQGEGYLRLSRFECGCQGGGALVVGAVGPVKGLDNFFDVFKLLLPGAC